MLIGSLAPRSITRQMPSTRSVMYMNERVCEPSPKTVSGSLRSACVKNAGMARPSLRRIRVPYELKMRRIRVSTRCTRW